MRQKYFSLLGASLAFPLFFTTRLTVYNGDATSNEFSLPLGLFVTLVCFSAFGWRSIFSFSRPGPVFLLGGLTLVSLGALFQIGVGDWSLFLIYYIPAVVGFFVAWTVKIESDEATRAIFVGFALAAVSAASLHLTASFVSFGLAGAYAVRGEDSIFGIFSIYQKYIYYATILAFGFFLVLFFFEGLMRWFGALVLVADILLVGSREAIVLVIVFWLACSFAQKRSLINSFFLLVTVLPAVGLILFTFYFFMREHLEDVVFIAKILDIFNSSDASTLSAGRLDTIVDVTNAFNIDGWFLFFGSGFRTDIGELGTPHNQYVEWFLRGGIFFVLTNIFILCASIYRYFVTGGRINYAAGVLLLSALVICNNINTPFRVPYTGVFLWFLIGLSFKPSVFRLRASQNLKNISVNHI